VAALEPAPTGWVREHGGGFTIERVKDGFPEYKLTDFMVRASGCGFGFRFRKKMLRGKLHEPIELVTMNETVTLEYDAEEQKTKVRRVVTDFVQQTQESLIGRWTPGYWMIKWAISRDENFQWSMLMKLQMKKKKQLQLEQDPDAAASREQESQGILSVPRLAEMSGGGMGGGGPPLTVLGAQRPEMEGSGGSVEMLPVQN